VLSTVAAAVLGACGGTDATGTTAPPEQATTTTAFAPDEGSLVVYSGRDEAFVQPVVDAFTAATGIEVAVRYAGTGELATAILEEGDNSPADVFWAQDPAFIGGLANEGALTALPEEILTLVPDRYRDAEGSWVGVTGRSRVMVRNTDLVADGELPDSVFDLTEPEWTGRVGIAPTNGSFVAFVSAMILSEGEEATRDWLEGMAANDPQIFDANGPIVDAVVAGDLDAGLVNHYYLLQRIAELGDGPADNHFFPAGDPGALVMATGAGVVAGSDMADEAEQFIDFMLQPESQAHFLSLYEYPLIDGAGSPDGQVPLAELPPLDIDLTDTAATLDPALSLIAEAGLS
jgi:iron(III) transport system substrate-binding protein